MADIIPFDSGPVQGLLHRPTNPIGDGVVLTHGAGGDCRSPLLVAVANCLADSGISVLRYDLPFRRTRPHGPPFPAGASRDREGLREAAHAMRSLVPGHLILGGHSYGGRQASMLMADDPTVADALLLLSYPLHPPKKLHDVRTGHFHALRRPAMFVHGTSDPFGTIEEIQNALILIPGPTVLVPIEKAGHDLLKGRFEIVRLVIEPFKSMIENHRDS
jgi:uncharacterized protein